jgi:hypothetical protein
MRTALIAILLAACTTDPAPIPTGPHYQYVMKELKIATSNNDARAYGLDLNGDGMIDNNLGMVFGTLQGHGLGVDGTAREALVRGGISLLADLQTTDFVTSEVAGITTYLGTDPSPAPCLDPARIETCGQQLLGTGHFAIERGSESDVGAAPIEDNELVATMDVLPVEIALDPTVPLRLDLYGARVRFTRLSDSGFVGVLGGAIVKDDIDRVIVPQAHHEIERIVGAECGQPDPTATCGCIGGSRADILKDLFDENHDCEISLEEVQRNNLLQALLSPDVRVNGQDSLSFGVGVEFVRAKFE